MRGGAAIARCGIDIFCIQNGGISALATPAAFGRAYFDPVVKYDPGRGYYEWKPSDDDSFRFDGGVMNVSLSVGGWRKYYYSDHSPDVYSGNFSWWGTAIKSFVTDFSLRGARNAGESFSKCVSRAQDTLLTSYGSAALNIAIPTDGFIALYTAPYWRIGNTFCCSFSRRTCAVLEWSGVNNQVFEL
jgi:hypothetical protein